MKKNFLNKALSVAVSLAVAGTTLASLSVSAFAADEPILPEPKAVYDFSYSFEELAAQDEGFEVVENAATPKLVDDEEMGQVLQLGKAVIKDQVFLPVDGAASGYLESDGSEYSTINISNPFKGMGIDLYEFEPYEDVALTTYRNCEQPLWKKGITISYWIKSPAGEDGLGVNSNVVGFTSNRYQMQSDDYAKHLTTVKYDLEHNSMTDEERAMFGETCVKAGVILGSDFYFELASNELYLDEPIYKDPDGQRMGRIYWMNPNFEGTHGYVKKNDGSIDTTYNADRYDWWNVAPILNDAEMTEDNNGSRIRYAWTYSEMWLDASSSFYFENDSDNVNKQLNPNHVSSYGTRVGMQHCDSFNINSWKGEVDTLKKAVDNGTAAESPLTAPDEWHNVVCVIQNDWVTYYLDGEEIAVEDEYSSFGQKGLAVNQGGWKPWKRLNKGTGSRYGYGTDKTQTYWCWYGNYCAPTMMEWIVKDCVNAKIGGGNVAGDGYLMTANTDEIKIKNVVFYADVLNEKQAAYIYENPDLYSKREGKLGDVNEDEKINAQDALEVLKHAASITVLEGTALANADVNADEKINASDALEILKLAAGIITEFTPAQ